METRSIAARTAYELRGILVAPPILAAAACSWGAFDHALVTWPLGVALFLVGWIVRIWAQRHVAYRLKVRKVLTGCGPYAYVRNPIYLGNILMGLGAVAASEMLWMLPLTLVWYVAVYSLVIRQEESQLASRYGASYVAYQGAVRRWLPRLPEGREPSCPHTARGGVLLSELHTPLIMAPPALKALGVFVVAAHFLDRLRLG